MVFNSPDRIADLTRQTIRSTGCQTAARPSRTSCWRAPAWSRQRRRGRCWSGATATSSSSRAAGTSSIPTVSLVGRAVTAVFMPLRPDLDKVVLEWGAAKGWSPRQNTWVIDNLIQDDVVVVDMFGKVRDGTFAGDNLATAIKTRTGTGMVVDGGIRDARQIEELDDFNAFVRGIDPSAIAEVTLVGVNIPVRIGGATVFPGDLVLGTSAGVTFIPPALVEEIVLHSEETRLRDEFGKGGSPRASIASSQIDTQTWEPEIQADYLGLEGAPEGIGNRGQVTGVGLPSPVACPLYPYPLFPVP